MIDLVYYLPRQRHEEREYEVQGPGDSKQRRVLRRVGMWLDLNGEENPEHEAWESIVDGQQFMLRQGKLPVVLGREEMERLIRLPGLRWPFPKEGNEMLRLCEKPCSVPRLGASPVRRVTGRSRAIGQRRPGARVHIVGESVNGVPVRIPDRRASTVGSGITRACSTSFVFWSRYPDQTKCR